MHNEQTRDSCEAVYVKVVSLSVQLQQQQHLRCFLLGFNMSLTHSEQHLLSRETRALTASSVWLSARLTFCPSAWGCLEQDVATQAISSNPSGSSEEVWHPWPWKQWFLLWWNIYSFICVLFSLLLPCYPTLRMSFVRVDTSNCKETKQFVLFLFAGVLAVWARSL